jgi:sporulation protein YlmC with PRC-barrel domain
MKIRFGLPVSGADGPVGEVGDLVIDPTTHDITHIVVEPHHRHRQARLVPLDVVHVDDGGVSVRLDSRQMRSLPKVSRSDFVRFDEEIDLGDDWDVGVECIVAMPYTGDAMGANSWAARSGRVGVTIDYDRIPKGECEIRRESRVESSDGHTVGIVDGFIADETHIEAMIVQTGLPGFRHLVVVPIGSVARVSNDEVEITLTKQLFRRLEPAEGLGRVHGARTPVDRIEHATASFVKRWRTRLGSAGRRRRERDDGANARREDASSGSDDGTR